MSKQGRTLWEILTQPKPVEVPIELQYKNPLEAKVGQYITISNEEPIWGGRTYEIQDIQVYKRVFKNSDPSYIIDYRLFSQSIDQSVKLRLVPNTEGRNLKYDSIMLKQFDEFEYDENFKLVCQDPTGIFQINEDENGKTLDENEDFYRIPEHVFIPYHVEVTVIKDVDGDGKVEREEVKSYEMDYWDFWRDTFDKEHGVTFRQFLFVEMDNSTGYFQLWRGRQVPTTQIMVI